MGLPIDKMIIATNENDILHRCLQNNDYSKKDLKHTITPSMDIMISSNFERMLYYAYDKNSQAINELMHNFNEFHKLELDCKAIDNLHRIFSSNNVTETEIIDTIYKIYQSNNEILDPHTATGIFASMQNVKNNEKIISLATAHPIKFQDAIDAVNNKYKTNINIENNEKFADENYNILENDSEVVYNYINNILKG